MEVSMLLLATIIYVVLILFETHLVYSLLLQVASFHMLTHKKYRTLCMPILPHVL